MSGIASVGRPATGIKTMRAAALAIGLGATTLAMPPTGAVAQSADQTPAAIQQAIPVVAQSGMVVAQEPRAARIGVDILQKGGNAVDAAVAVGFALAVSYPRAGNIGGGGFMLIHRASGGDTAIDYRETAPAGINAKSFLDAAGQCRSAEVARIRARHRRAGHRRRSRARRGEIRFRPIHACRSDRAGDRHGARRHSLIADDLADLLPTAQARLARWPSTAQIFLKADGSALAAGDRLVQSDLADTLQAIARDGPRAFYEGRSPQKIAAAVQAAGGVMTADDLKGYRAVERAPVRGTYRGYDIVSMPPPSSGGVELIEMLNILEGYDLAHDDEAQTLYLMIEAMKRAYADRALFLGDPDAVAGSGRAADFEETTPRPGAPPSIPRHATPASAIHAGGTGNPKAATPRISRSSIVSAMRCPIPTRSISAMASDWWRTAPAFFSTTSSTILPPSRMRRTLTV